MLAKVYIREFNYKIESIGIPSLDKNFITYIPLVDNPSIELFRIDQYFHIFIPKEGWLYSDKKLADAIIYDKTYSYKSRRYIYLPDYKCSSTFNVKEPTEELVKSYIEGYKCL